MTYQEAVQAGGVTITESWLHFKYVRDFYLEDITVSGILEARWRGYKETLGMDAVGIICLSPVAHDFLCVDLDMDYNFTENYIENREHISLKNYMREVSRTWLKKGQTMTWKGRRVIVVKNESEFIELSKVIDAMMNGKYFCVTLFDTAFEEYLGFV